MAGGRHLFWKGFLSFADKAIHKKAKPPVKQEVIRMGESTLERVFAMGCGSKCKGRLIFQAY